MHILVIGQNGEIFFTTSPSNPWTSFFEHLTKNGNTLAVEINCDAIDALICLGYHPSILELSNIKNIIAKRKILINWEPHVVEPELYKTHYFTNFSLRLSPSTDWATKIEGRSFPWPQSRMAPPPSYKDFANRENRVVIIQANKFSGHKEAKYRLRRKIIKSLGSKGLLVLYGHNWNSNWIMNLRWWFANIRRHKLTQVSFYPGSLSRVSNDFYLGVVGSKSLAYEKYQTALVIENSLDYVSEKVFDSVSNGCLTVYVGQRSNSYFKSTPKELLPEPAFREVTRAILNVMSLSDKQRYELFLKQYFSLKENENEALNVNVFVRLAAACVQELSL